MRMLILVYTAVPMVLVSQRDLQQTQSSCFSRANMRKPDETEGDAVYH